MEQVYCTNCIHFEVVEVSADDYTPKCKHEDKCDLFDCEDSRSINERPFYKSIVIKENK